MKYLPAARVKPPAPDDKRSPKLDILSLEDNYVGDEGAFALAAVLKETKITSLEYASTSNRTAFAFVSAPADTHHSCPPMQLGQERDLCH